jgi:hypothetical protein
MSPTEQRLALRDMGYSPIPCRGKVPNMPGWQCKVRRSDDEIRGMAGANTGLLAYETPAIDLDVNNPFAADRLEELAREHFDDGGTILTRVGRAPRRALILRCEEPFAKMVAVFRDANGASHKIEILGDGQQFVAFGVHPDTGVPYTYSHEATPLNTPRADLAEITEEQGRTFLNRAAALLLEEFVMERVDDMPAGDAPETSREPVDADRDLAEMRFGGGIVNGVNWTQLRCTGSLLRNGVTVDCVVDTVLDATRAAVADNPDCAGWDWDAERVTVEGMCYRLINDNPELSVVLPDKFRDEFEEAVAAGGTPKVTYRRGAGWHLRAYKPKPDLHVVGGTDTPPPRAASLVIDATPFRRFDPYTLPRREWLYGKHYQAGIVTATIGQGGIGKSSLGLVEILAMCTGRDLLGEQPTVRARAWYHNADEDDEIYRRLAAALQHYDISQDDLEDWLHVTSGVSMPIKVTKAGTGGLRIDSASVEAVIRTIARYEINVAIFDPLVATHTATENISGEMDQVVREFSRIADATDCAIDIVHHTRKPAAGQEEFSVMDSRGAGAIVDAVRSARVLNVMSKSEADRAGIDEVDRRYHFRLDKGKANMAPPAAARWYKFSSLDIPNGDNVGVVTAWAYPGQDDTSPASEEAGHAAEKVFLALLARFTREGRGVGANKGVNYAPLLFSKEKEAKTAKVGRDALEAAMRRLFERNVIRVETTGTGGKAVNRLVEVGTR